MLQGSNSVFIAPKVNIQKVDPLPIAWRAPVANTASPAAYVIPVPQANTNKSTDRRNALIVYLGNMQGQLEKKRVTIALQVSTLLPVR